MYLPPRTNTDVCHMPYPKPNLLFISNILYPNGMASLTFWRRTGPSKKEPSLVEIPKHAKIGMYICVSHKYIYCINVAKLQYPLI